MVKTNMLVILIGCWSSNEYKFTFGAELLLCENLKLLANAGFLMIFTYGQIREVTGIVKVRHASSYANKFTTRPGADCKVAIRDHTFHAVPIINRAALTQS